MDEKEYNKIKEKHSLPNWQSINNEFELANIEEENFLLRAIAKKVDDRLDSYLHLSERLLVPDAGSMSDIYEAKCFDDKTKQEILEVFKKLKFLKSQYNEATLTRDDSGYSKFINESLKVWDDLKKKILPWVKELESCWLKAPDKEDLFEYLG